jgi:GNAT superfamily N-acetyltransferase
MEHLLDNAFWHALSGSQARFATGTGTARRYAPGFSPMLGFADTRNPDFAALAPYCQRGESFYCSGWTGESPADWRVEVEAVLLPMVWDAPMPAADEAPEAIALGPEHVQQAVDLAALTRPGPFGPRTLELGEYFGVFEGDRLIAMAGERLQIGRLREISGVCTHPDLQGRGLARRLMAKVLRRQMQRGDQPFLHVMRHNEAAHALYQRMGFRNHREQVARVVVFGG